MPRIMDYIFILSMKAFRRAQNPDPKSLHYESIDDRLESAVSGVMIFVGTLYAFSLLTFIILPIVTIGLGIHDFELIEFLIWSTPLGFIIFYWLLVYFRYLKNDNWKKIERNIDSKPKWKRDQKFIMISLAHITYSVIFFLVFFQFVVPIIDK